MVERSFSIRQALGSMPRFSNFFICLYYQYMNNYSENNTTHFINFFSKCSLKYLFQTKINEKKKVGPTGIRTLVKGFKVPSTNRYTIEPEIILDCL